MEPYPYSFFLLLPFLGFWGASCAAPPVAAPPVPPVKTRPIQEVSLAKGVSAAPAFPTKKTIPSRSLKERGRVHGEPWARGGEREGEGAPVVLGRHFDAFGFYEDEIGGHHKHGVVTLDGIYLFVLRTAHIYKSPVERARAVARLLEENLHGGNFLFVLGKEGKNPAIYAVAHHRAYPRLIVTVTRGDALGYSLRRDRLVSQEEVGRWWLEWLEGLVGVVFLEGSPSHPSLPRAEEALTLLGRKLRELFPQKPYAPDQVAAAIEALDEETQGYLRSLALSFSEDPLGEGAPGDQEHGH